MLKPAPVRIPSGDGHTTIYQWMFADVDAKVPGFNLGHLNPLRWSRQLPIAECIVDLEKVQASGRPISLKLSSSASEVMKFDCAEDAVRYLYGINPSGSHWQDVKDSAEAAILDSCRQLAVLEEKKENAAIQLEAAKAAEEEANAAKKTVKSELDCAWRFGDLASGHAAGMNVLRWSGKLSIEEGISALEEVVREQADRPVRLKVPAWTLSKSQKFKSASEALEYLSHVCPLMEAAQEVHKKSIERVKIASRTVADIDYMISQMMQTAETSAITLKQAENGLHRSSVISLRKSLSPRPR
eukprot:TRINITY_DN62082_c0_g1_i1.p1 TRINITY_DN62082_c0_g1~~TRINITY_DN62082_c0_g1_i1.p1  ORF type:complete len:299 (-),score=42.84 TRINITY_DN62082_c0_g1_i1:28-924(-)